MNPFQTLIDELPPDMLSELMDEVRTGWHQQEVEAQIAQAQLGADNHQQHHAIEGIGRLRLNVDPVSFHYWGHRLGYDCWKNRQFLDEYERDNPAARVNCGGTRIQVGFQGAPRHVVRRY